jgi:phenylpropionate dioxygenase-like ring-hydroxylating dioxygenase large terminal subunit
MTKEYVMQHALQVRILKELMQQIDEKKNIDAGVQYKIPTSSYVCPDLAEKEWQAFFQNHPQLIGFSGDLAGPGHYFTSDDFGAPVLATRDKDGKFHAFLNACRHRGARITEEQRGETNLFVCPYHFWGYSSQGELMAIPQNDHFGEIDKSCHGLVELPSVEKDGFLWIHPQPDGHLDIDALLGPLSEELASGKFGELVYSGESTIDMKLNWKLANDTFGETYHFQKLHKNTLGQSFYGDNLAYEEIGQHHRFVFARKVIDLIRDLPEEQWQLCQGATLVYYLFPNIQITVGVGRATLIRIYPDPKNSGRSITRISHYFSQEAIDKVDASVNDSEAIIVTSDNVFEKRDGLNVTFTLDAMMKVFNDAIENEDYVMGEGQQETAASGLLDYSIFGRNEAPLHHYHNTFRKALDMPPLEQL